MLGYVSEATHMFSHIVFVSFLDNTDEVVREEIFQQHRELGEKCGGAKAGITLWRVERNLDTRKGVHLVQLSTFTSQEAFEAFRRHEAHQQFATILRDVANWVVADFSD